MTGLVFGGIFDIGFVFGPQISVTVRSITLKLIGQGHVPPRLSYSTSFNCPGCRRAVGICGAMENRLVYHAVGQYYRF